MRWSLPLLCLLLGVLPATTSSAAHVLLEKNTEAVDGEAMTCRPRSSCCRVCRRGQACGNSCISRDYNCHRGEGCACDAAEICR